MPQSRRYLYAKYTEHLETHFSLVHDFSSHMKIIQPTNYMSLIAINVCKTQWPTDGVFPKWVSLLICFCLIGLIFTTFSMGRDNCEMFGKTGSLFNYPLQALDSDSHRGGFLSAQGVAHEAIETKIMRSRSRYISNIRKRHCKTRTMLFYDGKI